MDPAQGETGGKSITSKLKAKVKGVKGKVHLPGHKKRHNGDGQGDDGDSSDYSSDDSPRKPGLETGYNVGDSTPFTTVKTTPLPPAREKASSHESHNRDYDSRPSHNTTSGYGAHDPPTAPPTRPAPMASDSPRSMARSLDATIKYREGDNTSPRDVNYPNDQSYQTGQPYSTSATEGMPKIGYSENSSSPSKPSPGVLGHVKDTVGGAAAAVGSKMGYYTEVDATPAVPLPRDPNAPSVMDKAKATLGMDKPRDPNSPTLMEKTKATLGLDKPSDPNAPSMMEKTKATLGMDKPRDPNAPSMMEKTKATLGMDKPRDPNAPTLMEKTKATLGLGPASPNTVTSPSAGNQPGVIDRVSGAMSSLFTSSPKGTGEDVQHTFPAQSDYVPPAATVPHQTYGDRSGERMTTSPTGDYNPMMNR